jgi:glycosyltransferase involved in cell wall biosynthesis
MREDIPHICVCVCTFKRPAFLARLLRELARQKTEGRFTFSVVIVDNDAEYTSKAVIEAALETHSLPIRSLVEPERGIARARNAVISAAEGDYFALIDDDEFPDPSWLLQMLETCETYHVDGVLGPVKQYYETPPPAWLLKCNLVERKIHPTGTAVAWREARTGNALLHSRIFSNTPAPFRTDLKSSSDTAFFQRKLEQGYRLIWSGEAAVYEISPPQRWQRRYFLRRSLLNGAMSVRMPGFSASDVLKSIVALPIYTVSLPVALLCGQHRWMKVLVKLCHHLGRLLSLVGIQPIRSAYIEG